MNSSKQLIRTKKPFTHSHKRTLASEFKPISRKGRTPSLTELPPCSPHPRTPPQTPHHTCQDSPHPPTLPQITLSSTESTPELIHSPHLHPRPSAPPHPRCSRIFHSQQLQAFPVFMDHACQQSQGCLSIVLFAFPYDPQFHLRLSLSQWPNP